MIMSLILATANPGMATVDRCDASGRHSYRLSSDKKVRNIIFCIGDGMGLGQIMLTRIKTCGADGTLYIEQLPITGIINTHSANALVTDSAAAGTAMACGVKTNNGMIGQTPDGKNYQTILEACKQKGMATGLVATSTITHATPASFASHVKSRDMQDVIAEQLLANNVTVLLGGGREYFLPMSDPKSKRKDEKNLIEQAKAQGYSYVQTAEELKKVNTASLLGLFQPGPLTTLPPEPTLPQLTDKAIQLLNDAQQGKDEGFFLMVEGSQIDWACHENDANNTIRQTILFDQAVKEALDFAVTDGQTLIVVTADHETAGLTINDGKLDGTALRINWSTKGHTASAVPVFAFGPNAQLFAGVYDNTDLPKKLAQLAGINSFPKPEVHCRKSKNSSLSLSEPVSTK